MEDWVQRALARWPDVPALYGWLSLDRRGRWRIRGETISRPQIIDTINANYAADERGCWYFQNGPQRGYIELDYAPMVLMRDAGSQALRTHTGRVVTRISRAFIDEQGDLLLLTEHGAGLLIDTDLDWALSRLSAGDDLAEEEALAAALGLASGAATGLQLALADPTIQIERLDFQRAPALLGFVRKPMPD